MVATIGSWLCKIEIVTHHHTTNFVNLTSTQWLYSTAWSIAQHSWVLWLKFCLWHQINTINIFSPPPHATQLPPPSLFRGTLDDRAAIIQADALAGCQKCFTHCWYREDRCEQGYSLARWPPRLFYLKVKVKVILLHMYHFHFHPLLIQRADCIFDAFTNFINHMW